MKKKCVLLLLTACMLTLSACAKKSNAAEICNCTCEGCADCVYKAGTEEASDIFAKESDQETEIQTVENTEVAETSMAVDENIPLSELTEGEKEARRQQQSNLVAAREQVYAMTDSLEKTQKINELDKQILANNVYDFSTLSIQFFGDSITEGICGKVDEDGNYISYVNYANEYLQFGNCMNNGKAGRMFADFGGQELSFSLNMGSMYNNSANVSVIFLGVNDYLTSNDAKRYGDMYATESTAGYIGSVRYAIKQLKASYPNQDIFFVTMYDVAKESYSTYTDVAGNPTLSEYMEVLRKLVAESGYHLIELNNIGFMDCTDLATSNAYTEDGLHPNDSGNRILGEHIAAEISVYYSQKQ